MTDYRKLEILLILILFSCINFQCHSNSKKNTSSDVLSKTADANDGLSIENFEKFYKSNFVSMVLPIDTKQLLKQKFGIETIDTGIIAQGYHESYSKLLQDKNQKKIIKSDYINSTNIKTMYPVGYKKLLNDKVVLLILEMSQVFPDNYYHNLWAKIFNSNGDLLDSLIVDSHLSYEYDLWTSSKIYDDFNLIKLENRIILYNENGESIERSKNIEYSFNFASNKFHSNNGKEYLFQGNYYVSSLSEILHDYMNDCLFVKELQIGDINEDGYKDLICILLPTVKNGCLNTKFDFMISLNNKRGLYKYQGTQMGIDLNEKNYEVKNLRVDSSLVSFDITKLGVPKELTFYYKFNKVKNQPILDKVVIRDTISKSEYTETLEENSSNYLIQHSAKIAKRILQ